MARRDSALQSFRAPPARLTTRTSSVVPMNENNSRRTLALLAVAAATLVVAGVGCQQQQNKQQERDDTKFVAWYDRLARKPAPPQLGRGRPAGMPGAPVTPGARRSND